MKDSQLHFIIPEKIFSIYRENFNCSLANSIRLNNEGVYQSLNLTDEYFITNNFDANMLRLSNNTRLWFKLNTCNWRCLATCSTLRFCGRQRNAAEEHYYNSCLSQRSHLQRMGIAVLPVGPYTASHALKGWHSIFFTSKITACVSNSRFLESERIV
mgnify:CR=1 FL=1